MRTPAINAEQSGIDAEVREALDLLLEPGRVTELRALGTTQGTVSGYFDACGSMTEAAAKLSGKADGVYFTLNPVNPDLLARASNRVKSYAKHTTKDSDILDRRWIPLDFDPKRPAGVSSTDEEHRLALERATKCREWLSCMGWPDPIVADSGNGGHLLYAVDLPNDADTTSLVKRALDALALRFSDENVELDSKTFNAARIWKLYGTLAAKGDSTSQRPHRRSKILQRPDWLKAVTREQLSALAIPEASPPESQRRSGQALDVTGWLAKYGIDVAQQKPWQGGTCYILRVCPNNAEHNRGEAVVLQFANGGIAAKCQHVSCGLTWNSLRERYEPPAAGPNVGSSLILATSTRGPDEKQNQQSKSQASRLVDIGKQSELFHTPDGVAYACLEINDHREIWATNSKAFRESLLRSYFFQTGAVPNSQAVRDAITTLDGIARFDGAEYQVHVRVAGDDQRIWLDLGNANWEVVEITAAGWRVIANPLVRFRRAAGLLSLPTPEPGGSVSGLKVFLNISDVNAWSLILSWCVSAMRPVGPYPVLYLLGEQGSAKSTATRVIRDLIDPFKAPLRSMPRDERDLYIAANNGRVIAFDNVSRLEPWLSDALCRLATGGGFSTRTLYTDNEEVLFDMQRPIIMNGIEEVATRGDFLERAIMVTLPTISETERKDETTFWADYERARPRILGAILDGVSTALRRVKSIRLERKPRMADFATWSTAAEVEFGFEPGTFEKAYSNIRSAAHDLALEAVPIFPYIQHVVQTHDWVGTADNLLRELNRLQAASGEKKPKGWPESQRGLSDQLRRLAPNLRSAGIIYEVSSPGHQSRRRITLSSGGKTSPMSPMPPGVEAFAEYVGGDLLGNKRPTPQAISPSACGQ